MIHIYRVYAAARLERFCSNRDEGSVLSDRFTGRVDPAGSYVTRLLVEAAKQFVGLEESWPISGLKQKAAGLSDSEMLTGDL